MRVLFFSEGFGSASFITNQVNQISQSHRVLYICNHWHGSKDIPLEVKEIPFRYPTIIRKIRDRLEMHGIYLTFFNPLFLVKLKKEVQAFKPDIIHLQFGYEGLRFIDNYPNIQKTPIIVHFRGYDASQKLTNRAYVKRLKGLLNTGNIYSISVSESLVKNLKKSRIQFNNHPRILHSNTDLDYFKRSNYQIDNNVFRLIQVSSFREKKGHEITLNALRLYIDKTGDTSILLIFTGEKSGNQYLRIQKMVNDLKLESFVDFVGHVNRQQVKSLLEESHCAILHSITTSDGDQEGIPNALMEAMAMEMPVISTYHSGIPELVKENECTILVEERDIDSYVNAIIRIRNNWKWVPSNRLRIKNDFSSNNFSDELNKIYSQLYEK